LATPLRLALPLGSPPLPYTTLFRPSGAFFPHGTIDFTLKLGGNTVFTTSEPVSGNGDYRATYTLPTSGNVSGTYTWSAVYSGDANNNDTNDHQAPQEHTLLTLTTPT